jgi:hypothetical protein
MQERGGVDVGDDRDAVAHGDRTLGDYIDMQRDQLEMPYHVPASATVAWRRMLGVLDDRARAEVAPSDVSGHKGRPARRLFVMPWDCGLAGSMPPHPPKEARACAATRACPRLHCRFKR